MRNEPNLRLDRYRREHPVLGCSPPGTSYGFFVVDKLIVISSGVPDPDVPDAHQWEHVSVSHSHRCPTWEEMCKIKDLFWRDDETVLQFHPKRSEYVNNHPYVLHMWRRVGVDHELPPRELIGV